MDTSSSFVLRQTREGRWILKAFDEKGRSLGAPVIIDDALNAWKVLCLMLGYGDLEHTIPTEMLERGELIIKEAA